MVSNYIVLLLSILGILIFVFKIKNSFSLKLLGITILINGMLVSIAQIMSIEHILNYPIAVLGLISFIIMTIKAWNIRKIPEKKVVACIWLIGIPCIATFALIMYILIESGVFG